MEVSGEFHDAAALTPGETALDIHWIGGLVGPRNIYFLWRESNPCHSACSTFLYRLSYAGFTTHYRHIIDFVKTDIKQCNLQTMNITRAIWENSLNTSDVSSVKLFAHDAEGIEGNHKNP
jgi:hypothetical protein